MPRQRQIDDAPENETIPMRAFVQEPNPNRRWELTIVTVVAPFNHVEIVTGDESAREARIAELFKAGVRFEDKKCVICTGPSKIEQIRYRELT